MFIGISTSIHAMNIYAAVSNWILATGAWRDIGVWDDTAVWNDSAP